MPDKAKMQAERETSKKLGANVRKMRGLKTMSQEALGNEIGVTFQQVQKMEKGLNHITCARLISISEALGVDVRDFFTALIDGNDGEANYTPEHPRMINAMNADLSMDAYRLAMAFDLVKSPTTRQRMIDLILSVGEENTKQPQSTKRRSKTKRVKADA